MGAAISRQPKQADEGFVAQSPRPIHFSSGLIQQLEDGSATGPKQTTLDEQVKSRIQREVARLRQEEAQLVAQVEAALEKENLDRERALPADAASSDRLSREVQGILGKIQRNKVQRDEINKIVGPKQAALNACLREKVGRPLDCQPEVQAFRETVQLLEQEYIKSVRT